MGTFPAGSEARQAKTSARPPAAEKSSAHQTPLHQPSCTSARVRAGLEQRAVCKSFLAAVASALPLPEFHLARPVCESGPVERVEFLQVLLVEREIEDFRVEPNTRVIA